MPRGRSTFTKHQKEHTRQQRQRDKAERRNQRKQEKALAGSVDEMAELRRHAAERAALFSLGEDDPELACRRPLVKRALSHPATLPPGDAKELKT